jgi:hypothetical protein
MPELHRITSRWETFSFECSLRCSCGWNGHCFSLNMGDLQAAVDRVINNHKHDVLMLVGPAIFRVEE